MANEKPAKLKLTKLDWLSSCDFPAQGAGGAALLLKRNSDEFSLKAKVSKLSDELGLVFGYAFASSMDGGKTPHVDFQDDAIDADFLKVVTAFIEDGGRTDVNHDFEKDGKIVYAWPLLPEINKAMGISADVIGLAVAVKPSAETYKRFKDGELTGFSIAGEGARQPLEKARTSKLHPTDGQPVKKQVSLYTDEVDGHQHQLDICEDGSMWCSWATSAGAETTHSHAVSRDASGAVVILADSGHTHGLAEGQPAVVVVPEGAVVVTSVEMRAPTTNHSAMKQRAGESTRSVNAVKVNPQAENSMTTKANETDATAEKLATLEKRNTHLERVAKLSGAHKTHLDTLAADAQEQFLAKNEIERNQAIELAEKADPVEFTLDGVDYHKSTQGYSLAKRLRDEVEKNERVEIEKAAKETVGGMPGDDATHAALIKAVRKSGESAEMQTKMIEALKGANAIIKSRAVAPGSDGEANGQRGDAGGNPKAQLEKGLVAFCKANNIDLTTKWTVGLPRFGDTEEGASLKRAYDESRA